MRKALPWIVAVVVAYVLLTATVLYLLPRPWNWAGAAITLSLAARFFFTVRRAAQIGQRQVKV